MTTPLCFTHNGTAIDVIGQVGNDPGSYWGTGDITTQNHTLRRNATITAGDTNATDAFDPSVEWDGYPQDTFDGLGSHTVGTVTNEPVSLSCPVVAHHRSGDGNLRVSPQIRH